MAKGQYGLVHRLNKTEHRTDQCRAQVSETRVRRLNKTEHRTDQCRAQESETRVRYVVLYA